MNRLGLQIDAAKNVRMFLTEAALAHEKKDDTRALRYTMDAVRELARAFNNLASLVGEGKSGTIKKKTQKSKVRPRGVNVLKKLDKFADQLGLPNDSPAVRP